MSMQLGNDAPPRTIKPARLFTIEQANAMLPLVRAITGDLASLARDVMERRHRLAVLTAGRDLKPNDPYSDELAQMEAELERDALRLQEYVEELRELGVEPKGRDRGAGRFSLRNGRPTGLSLLASGRARSAVLARPGVGLRRAAAADGRFRLGRR